MTYQRNTFTAVMENYGKVLDYTTESQNSAGISAEKYEAVMDSMEAKINQLVATWEKFVNNLNTEGTFDAIISTLEKLIELLDTLLNDFGMSNLIIPTILGTLSGKAVISAGNTIREITKSIKGLTSASSTAGGVLKAMGQSGKVAASGISLLGGAVGIATGVISLIVTLVDNYNRKLEELKQRAIDASNAIQEQNTQMQSIADSYADLNERRQSADLTTAEIRSNNESLLELEDQLKDLYGNRAEQLDLINGRYEDQLEIIQEIQRAQADETYRENADQYANAVRNIQDATIGARDLGINPQIDTSTGSPFGEDLFKEFLEQNKDSALQLADSSMVEGMFALVGKDDATFKELKNSWQEFYDYLTTLSDQATGQEKKNIESLINSTSMLIDSLESYKLDDDYELAEAGANLDLQRTSELRDLWLDAKEAVQQYNEILADPTATEEQKQNVIDYVRDVQDEIAGTIEGSGFEEQFEDIFDEVFDSLDTASEFDFWLEYDENAQRYLETLNGVVGQEAEFNSESLDPDKQKALEAITEKADEMGVSFTTVIDILKEMGILLLTDAEKVEKFNKELKGAPAYNETLSSFADSMDSVNTRLTSLNDVVTEFNQNGYITSDMLKTITDNNLLEYLSISEGKLVANSTALLNEAEAARNDAKQKVAWQAITQINAVAAEAEANKTNEATQAMMNQQSYVNLLTQELVDLANANATAAEAGVALTRSMVGTGLMSESVASSIQGQVESILNSAFMQIDFIDSFAYSTDSATGSTDDFTDSLEDEKKALEEAKEAIQDEIDALKERQELLDGEKENLENLIDMFIEMFKQQLEDQKDALEELKKAEEDRYDAIEKALDEEEKQKEEYFENEKDRIEELRDADSEYYDERKEALEDELDAYQDKIDKQKELLQAKKEEQEYEDKLKDKVRDVAEIEAELAALQFDDSIEAQRKKLELAEELREKQEDLSDLQSDHEYDLQQDALDKELERFEELQKKKQEALEKEQEEMEDYWDERLDALEKEQDAWEKDLESRREQEEANHELIMTDIEEQIKAIEAKIDDEKTLRLEAIKAIDEQNLIAYNNLIEWNYTYGTGVRQDVIDAWIEAQNTLVKYNDICNGTQEILEYLAKETNNIETETAQLESKMKDVEAQASAVDKKIQDIKNSTDKATGAVGGLRDAWGEFNDDMVQSAEAIERRYDNLYRMMKEMEEMGRANIIDQPITGRGEKGEYIEKNHTGTPYVTSSDEDRKISKAMGLKSDEVVRILKVGEAVIPKNENLNRLHSKENIISQSATYRTNEIIKNSQSYSNDNSSNLTISIGDTIIQGNADNSIISKLDEYKKSIVNEVFSRINKHTALSGFRNTKSYI